MKRSLSALSAPPFDALIIGGGIFGAGIARDAAMRGLRVALIDKGDFAGGTSSRSSKLIHGGFRYLEQRAFGLVRESCRERQILQSIAPHLVRPMPFLLPVYEGARHSLMTMRLGMTIYDLLAMYRNTAPHRALSAEAAIEQEPSLDRHGLRGAIRFFDCQEDDARFCVENVLHAADLGATCANYCELTGFEIRNGRIVAARVVDRLGSRSFEISARVFINSAGPWVERVERLAAIDGPRIELNPTKGVHLLLPQMTRGHGIVFESRRDRRMMFAIPWHDCTMIGTTDTDVRENIDDVHADAADIDYLLDEARALMPDRGITRRDIITTFGGVRPLLRSDRADPSQRSREHRIVRQGENLLSVAGGKYTTYRAIAEQVVDRIYPLLDSRRAPRCQTAETLLPNRRPAPSGEKIADVPAVHASDVVHACREEMAMTVSDVMRRRTPLALSRYGDAKTAEAVAKVMMAAMGWDDATMRRSLREYIDEWMKNRPEESVN